MNSESELLKQCPFCKEEIKEEATKCKFCKSRVDLGYRVRKVGNDITKFGLRLTLAIILLMVMLILFGLL